MSNLVRSDQSLDLIEQAYKGVAESELVLTSYQLRQAQKNMLAELASRNAMSQAAVIRAIIDEWCEMKLRDKCLPPDRILERTSCCATTLCLPFAQLPSCL